MLIEMAVLNGSGISRHQLARLLIPMTLVYLLAQGFLMLWASPWGFDSFEALTSEQAVRTGFDLVRPQNLSLRTLYHFYAGDLSEDRKT